MVQCLSCNIPRTVRVNEQQAFQVCALTADLVCVDASIIATLGNPSQKEAFELFMYTEGQFVPVSFNDIGVFIYEEPTINSCALLFITFKETGRYNFQLDLVSENGNLPLADLSFEVNVVNELE
ncbi:hypothetical protein [Halobacillus sp. BBL2006]|uniref:hypothetical protein n=1 Tax=Halobacillus sp. BBL2006 TaxID=1543706 RepID=UPI000543E89C|nr:hypothetical protein [Halobacillus sp. BBL2006]KHE67205.1 hypothetical protein LD39_18735 [Halobacillus sp. BBL2006]